MSEQTNATVWGFLLAAGESRRMGGFPKPLLAWGDTTVGRRLVAEMAGSRLDRVFVVVGHEAARVREHLAGGRTGFVENAGYRDGMFTSIQAAVRAAAVANGPAGIMLMLTDQPLITAGVIDSLIAGFRAGRGGIAVPTFQGRRGHPVIIHSRYAQEILAMDPQAGLRPFMQRHADDRAEVAVDTPAVLRDMDTPADYAARLAEREGGGAA